MSTKVVHIALRWKEDAFAWHGMVSKRKVKREREKLHVVVYFILNERGVFERHYVLVVVLVLLKARVYFQPRVELNQGSRSCIARRRSSCVKMLKAAKSEGTLIADASRGQLYSLHGESLYLNTTFHCIHATPYYAFLHSNSSSGFSIAFLNSRIHSPPTAPSTTL